MTKYIVALEVTAGVATQWLAPWAGDPGRTCVKESATKFTSVLNATFGLLHARKYRDFLSAEILEAGE